MLSRHRVFEVKLTDHCVIFSIMKFDLVVLNCLVCVIICDDCSVLSKGTLLENTFKLRIVLFKIPME